jgi:hypothetical protein
MGRFVGVGIWLAVKRAAARPHQGDRTRTVFHGANREFDILATALLAEYDH